MTASRRPLRTLGWLLLLAVAVAACADQTERLWLEAPGWGRARLVGNTRVGDPVPTALDGAGGIYLFLISRDDGLSHPRVVALNRRAEVVWDRTYEVGLTQPDQPRILWDGKRLQLFWLSSHELYNARLEATGQLLGPPIRLSGEMKVGSYDVVRGAGGSMTIWYAGPRRDPGLYALPPGDPAGEATPVDAEGVRPDLQYDDAGTLHVTWAHYPPGYGDNRFFYAAYPDGAYRPGRETAVAEPRLGLSSVLQGPRLGLDQQYVYLFWTVLVRTGMEAGSAETNYIHFPHGQPPSESSVRQVIVPRTYNLSYRSLPGGDLEAGARVSLTSDSYRGTTYVTDLAVDSGLRQELAIAVHTRLDYLMRKEQGQVSTLFLQDGVPAAYQLLSFTPAASTDPAIFSDEGDRLYITWLERGELPGFMVYFASTAPDIREALGAITWDDVGRLTAETLFGLLAGALLLPFALMWIVVPVIVLGVTSAIRGEDERLTGFGTIVSLALALATYWVGKLALLPGVRDYVPFSAWLPFMPTWLDSPLRLGVPLSIAGLALATAWYYTYGQERRSVLVFTLIYAAVDGLLTMSVYGVLVYAAF